MKKIIAMLLSLSMVLSIGNVAFAADVPPNSTSLETSLNNITLDVTQMSSDNLKIYNDVLEDAIEYQNSIDSNFDQKNFVRQVNDLLYMMEYGTPMTRARAAIKFRIPNSVVSTAVNIAFSLIVGGVSTAVIKSFVAKYGVNVATNMIAKEVTVKLLSLGIKELSGLGTVIRLVIKNVLDPGSTIASWIDKRDPRPGNGYIDIAIG